MLHPQGRDEKRNLNQFMLIIHNNRCLTLNEGKFGKFGGQWCDFLGAEILKWGK